MPHKSVCLVINPRAGQNLAKLSHVLAVFSAAGWKVDLALKTHGGQTQELAYEAAKRGCDLLLAYGGDGTLNQVINGAMAAKGQPVIGLLPGGTANVWASEVGIPGDPVKAALAILASAARQIDLGHLEVAEVTIPGRQATEPLAEQQLQKKRQKAQKNIQRQARQHFLLMAGLGIDAAVMAQVSKSLKYRVGPLAVGLAAARALPEHRPFFLEVANTGQAGSASTLLWQGAARQVVIGNTRLYAGVVSMTPDALIDDGLLDVCVITAGDPLTTAQQIISLLLRRTPSQVTAHFFQGAHLIIRVPGSVPLQVDGSAVPLREYLSQAQCETLNLTQDSDDALVTYHLDALPRALTMAIPCHYDDTLFSSRVEAGGHQQQGRTLGKTAKGDTAFSLWGEGPPTRSDPAPIELAPEKLGELAQRVLEEGRKVKVVGASPHPTKEWACIVAGVSPSQRTGEVKPVAIVIDEYTLILQRSGEPAAPGMLQCLAEGAAIAVTGKKNKRGVIKANQVVV